MSESVGVAATVLTRAQSTAILTAGLAGQTRAQASSQGQIGRGNLLSGVIRTQAQTSAALNVERYEGTSGGGQVVETPPSVTSGTGGGSRTHGNANGSITSGNSASRRTVVAGSASRTGVGRSTSATGGRPGGSRTGVRGTPVSTSGNGKGSVTRGLPYGSATRADPSDKVTWGNQQRDEEP